MRLKMLAILAHENVSVAGTVVSKVKVRPGDKYLVTMRKACGSVVTGYVKTEDMPAAAFAAE